MGSDCLGQIQFISMKFSIDIQSFFSPTLQSMVKKSKALLMLINGLELVEI
jgi:hypothetical protein